MDSFSDILVPGRVTAGVVAANKKALFAQLAALAEAATGLDQKLVLERIGDRERLGSTGFGAGIAIPHGKIEGLDRVVGFFARLASPIDFGAIDDLPVDLVFLLLSPTDAGVDHLKALARVSRRMRDRAFVETLRGAGSPDAIYALFTAGDARDAA